VHVLVVDDSMTMRRIVIDSLRSIADADVIEAGSAEEALEVLRATPDVRLVLLDWYLPGMSGLDMIRAAQAEPALADVPTIMITSEREKQNVIAALRTGAKNYIVKPFTQAVFKKKVGPFLGARELPPPRSAGGLAGSLSHTSPIEVVQLIFITKKTGVLRFQSPEGAYALHFQGGQIVHAEAAPERGRVTTGEEAVSAATAITIGSCTFVADAAPHPVTERRSTDLILLDQVSRRGGE
jgi:two-component system chemotaxis response regulator CheY